jgi:2-polyprenyl-3-methyl-5-hydroxy-6-metoxy-1,4-benzoquinol methylase
VILIKNRLHRWQRALLDGTIAANPGLGLDKRAEGFVRMFENHIPARSRILDIGGGWGFYDQPLRQRGHEVALLDVVAPAYRRAPMILYDGERFPFVDDCFETSLLITVLHHVKDPAAVVREAQRVTRHCIIVVEDLYHHALGRLWTILRDRIYNFEFFGHPCRFKKKSGWNQFFDRLDLRLVAEKEIYTRLAGMRILNGVFVLQT